jgi:hypothetical protein
MLGILGGYIVVGADECLSTPTWTRTNAIGGLHQSEERHLRDLTADGRCGSRSGRTSATAGSTTSRSPPDRHGAREALELRWCACVARH